MSLASWWISSFDRSMLARFSIYCDFVTLSIFFFIVSTIFQLFFWLVSFKLKLFKFIITFRLLHVHPEKLIHKTVVARTNQEVSSFSRRRPGKSATFPSFSLTLSLSLLVPRKKAKRKQNVFGKLFGWLAGGGSGGGGFARKGLKLI